MPQWTLQHEKEFFKLAGFMLLCRFQLYNGYQCTHIRGHTKNNVEPLFTQMSYLGYSDSKGEIRLLLLMAEHLK